VSKVLIVDDDSALRRLLRAALTARGYDVVEATDGQEGLLAMEKEDPDLVLLDIAMPKMTGWEVLEALRERPELEKIPIVVISALGDEVRARGLGALAVLVKPFMMDRLYETVRSALREVE